MRVTRILSYLGLIVVLAIAACGGDDSNGSDDSGNGGSGASPTAQAPSGGAGSEATATAPAASTTEAPTGSDGGGAATGDLDACSLLTQDEVSAAIGQDAGAPASDNSIPPFASCRWEEDGITPVVSLSVYVGDDADDAESYFSFGAMEDYPDVEGLGDQAKRTQPIDEVDVLSGRYQFAIGLYFVSEDDDEEFEMAVELARLVLDRLP